MGIRFHRTAKVESGQGDAAAAFAAEVAKYVTEHWGTPTIWGLQVGGTYGTVHWFTDFANMTEFEAQIGRTLTDEGYRALLAKAQDYFVTGSTEDTIIYTM
jgi:hypothetical protein